MEDKRITIETTAKHLINLTEDFCPPQMSCSRTGYDDPATDEKCLKCLITWLGGEVLAGDSLVHTEQKKDPPPSSRYCPIFQGRCRTTECMSFRYGDCRNWQVVWQVVGSGTVVRKEIEDDML